MVVLVIGDTAVVHLFCCWKSILFVWSLFAGHL
jgi:hypothetical protein